MGSTKRWSPHLANIRLERLGGVQQPAPEDLACFAAFPRGQLLPRLLLLKSVESSRKSDLRSPDVHLQRDRLVDLASIDWWTARAATTPAILHSKNDMLEHVPAMVSKVWDRFSDSFFDIRFGRNAPDRAFQEVQHVAEEIQDFLAEALDSSADQLFVWVSLLRTFKVLQCVHDGSNINHVTHCFNNEEMVYLV